MPKFRTTIVTCLIVGIHIAPLTMGQTNRVVREAAVSTEIPEEIVVYGQKSIMYLRCRDVSS